MKRKEISRVLLCWHWEGFSVFQKITFFFFCVYSRGMKFQSLKGPFVNDKSFKWNWGTMEYLFRLTLVTNTAAEWINIKTTILLNDLVLRHSRCYEMCMNGKMKKRKQIFEGNRRRVQRLNCWKDIYKIQSCPLRMTVFLCPVHL